MKCSRCHTEQPETEFRTVKGKIRSVCRSCEKTYKLHKRYGLTASDYFDLVEKSNRRCGICNQEKELVVDHCHSTGEVRGLLCNQCNTALGLLYDRPDLFHKAADWCRR